MNITRALGMDLVVFDLDGTLLNAQSQVSAYTQETLALLTANNIAYTVATGRTVQSARPIIADCGFQLPHIYNNGIVVLDPASEQLSLAHLLTLSEAQNVVELAQYYGLTPFVSSVAEGGMHGVFHSEPKSEAEVNLQRFFAAREELSLHSLAALGIDDAITNVIMVGDTIEVEALRQTIELELGLVAYSGPTHDGDNIHWLDIHHPDASKGAAVTALKHQLGASRVICFGDSDNDVSLFAAADEAYAPANAKDCIKAAATEVIGHHDEDGIARFLRQRFAL